MAIRVALTHTSRYRYDRLVTLEPHVVRLRPAPHSRTPILAYSLRVMPEEHFLNWQQDPFGNYQARLVFTSRRASWRVEVDLVAEMIAINPFDFFIEEDAENYPFRYEAELAARAGARTSRARAAAGPVRRAGRRAARPSRARRTAHIDVLVDVNRDISQRLRYDIRMEPGVFAPDETLTRGHGSCRDFAWLVVQLLRRLGFAARFVSGYSIQLKADVKPLDGARRASPRTSPTCTPGPRSTCPAPAGLASTPTSGLLAGEGHIPLACTAGRRPRPRHQRLVHLRAPRRGRRGRRGVRPSR